MSYAYEYGMVVDQAPADARATFIRRTYAHLAAAVLAFVAFETFLLNLPGIGQFAGMMMQSWWLVLLAFMGVGYLAENWATSSTNATTQYIGLFLYVAVESVIFVPIMLIAELRAPGAIQSAAVMTLAVFGGLTGIVFVTRQDFSYLRSYLCVGGWLALGLIVCSMIFTISLGTWFSFAMVALMSGYILYYTSNIMHHYRTDQYVAASLALFASVATLFWYILRIAMSSRD